MMEHQMMMQEQQLGISANQGFAQGFDKEEMHDILSYTLDNDQILDKFEKQLRGLELVTKEDKEGNLYQKWELSGDPFMKESKGITDYIGFVSSLIGKNAIFSAFDVPDMKRFLKNVGHNIITWCENNHTRYGIDVLKVEPVMHRTIDIIELSIRRSLAGKERSYGYGAVPKEVSYRAVRDEPRNTGLFSNTFR